MTARPSFLRRTAATALCCGVAMLVPAASMLAATPPPAPAGANAYLRMADEARPLRETADSFIARAMAGDVAGTQAMLSRALVERIGEPAAQRALHGQILPFFAQGRETTRVTTIARTTDANGATGFAFYMWLKPADGSAPRPFTVYAVREQGRAVVANVVPDQLVPDRHQ